VAEGCATYGKETFPNPFNASVINKNLRQGEFRKSFKKNDIHLPGLKHSLRVRFAFVKHLPHSESHSRKGSSGKGASEGGKGIDRFLLMRARYERMAGVASGGGVISIESE
jgi:hypothetical protein